MSDDRSSFKISEFCTRNGISRGKYYTMKKKDKGPREMDVDGMPRISAEAERKWQKACEAKGKKAA